MVQKKYYCSLCRHLIREKGLKNLLPYKQYIGHKKESNPFKKLRKVRRGEQSLDANPSSQNSSFIDTGPADISSSIDQTVIEDMNLLSSMNKNVRFVSPVIRLSVLYILILVCFWYNIGTQPYSYHHTTAKRVSLFYHFNLHLEVLVLIMLVASCSETPIIRTRWDRAKQFG